MFLVGDETKHLVLLSFHALCMCLIVEDLQDLWETNDMDPV